MWGMLPTFFCSAKPPRRNVSDELEDIITTELDAIGYDLVELRRGGTRSRPVIEVRIDRRDGQTVSVDDCARVSRSIEARLDAGNVVSDRYVLQVSSPGDRPLRTPADWRRFVGRWVNVLSPDQGGRFEGQLVAVEEADGSESAVLELEKGRRKIIPLADVKEARLAFHW
jgi:ribosome maturation factor RimP